MKLTIDISIQKNDADEKMKIEQLWKFKSLK
jgi:hypothetical protein